jgi:hypothetical protein
MAAMFGDSTKHSTQLDHPSIVLTCTPLTILIPDPFSMLEKGRKETSRVFSFYI